MGRRRSRTCDPDRDRDRGCLGEDGSRRLWHGDMRFHRIPLAPSTNNLMVNDGGHGGGRRKSKRYSSWIPIAGYAIKPQIVSVRQAGEILPLTEKVFVCLIVPYRANADLDNKFKATLDLLKRHGVIEDDCMKVVVNIQCLWNNHVPDGTMDLIVSTTDHMLSKTATVEGNT